MISNILNKETIKIDDPINIIWTPANDEFTSFILKTGNKLLNIRELYYGNIVPNIIVCNNKIDYYNYCLSLSKNLHLPVLLIDHTIKSNILDDEKVKLLNNFPCYHHICLSKKISDSWNLNDVQILSYNIKDESNINIWKNIIFQLSKKVFKI